MTVPSYAVTRAAALGHKLIVRVRYQDRSGEERNVFRALTRVTRSRARRPFVELNWLGRHFGLTEDGAKRVLAELDADVNEGRATLVDIDDDEVSNLRRNF